MIESGGRSWFSAQVSDSLCNLENVTSPLWALESHQGKEGSVNQIRERTLGGTSCRDIIFSCARPAPHEVGSRGIWIGSVYQRLGLQTEELLGGGRILKGWEPAGGS